MKTCPTCSSVFETGSFCPTCGSRLREVKKHEVASPINGTNNSSSSGRNNNTTNSQKPPNPFSSALSRAAVVEYPPQTKSTPDWFPFLTVFLIVFGVITFIMAFTSSKAIGVVFSLIISISCFFLVFYIRKQVRISNELMNASLKRDAEERARKELERARYKYNNYDYALNEGINRGFVFSKIVDVPNHSQFIAVDFQNKQWLLNLGERRCVFRQYPQLVSFELCKDGSSILSGSMDLALLGGLLFGTVGAIVGAAAPRSINQTCSSLSVSITDNQANVYNLSLLSETVSCDSQEYKYAAEIAKEILSILKVIERG